MHSEEYIEGYIDGFLDSAEGFNGEYGSIDDLSWNYPSEKDIIKLTKKLREILEGD